MLNKDFVAFRKGLLVGPVSKVELDKVEAYTLQAELMRLGYMINPKQIPYITGNRAIELYNNIVPNLKDLLGDGNYRPLYIGFPKQVMEMSEFELFIDQITHYASNGTWFPNGYTNSNPIMFEHVEYKVINLCTEDEFKKIFTDLISVNNSLTPTDTSIVKWFVESGQELVMPEDVPFKENLCLLASLGVENIPVKTPTDVLRIAVHMSGGDISLPSVPKGMRDKDAFKFKKFTRKERRYLLQLLENSSCDVTEMKLKVNRWIRLGEIIHPNHYADKFPNAFRAFANLRNNIKNVKTFNSKFLHLIQKGVSTSELKQGLNILLERPGEFARRLDFLLRTHDTKLVLSKFTKVSNKVSNKVLFEMFNHFNSRDKVEDRYVTIKGHKNPRKINPLEPLSPTIITSVKTLILQQIYDNFSKKEKMEGTFYIDPRLKDFPIPANMRSISEGLLAVPRGAKIPIGTNANCVRFYTHWVDKNGREDLDLSAFLLSADGRKTSQLSWNGSLKESFGCHSGDVRCVVGDCAEYVDVLIDKAIEAGFRYVVMSVTNFQNRALKTVNPTIGWMEREFPESSTCWSPKSVKNSISLDSYHTSSKVGYVDLVERCFVYIDETTQDTYITDYHANDEFARIKRYENASYMSAYDVISMNIKARGGIVSLTDGYTRDYDGVLHVEKYPAFMLEEILNDYTKILNFML